MTGGGTVRSVWVEVHPDHQPVAAFAQQTGDLERERGEAALVAADPLAVEPGLGGIVRRAEAHEVAHARLRRGVEAALVPDEALIVAHLRRMGQPARRELGPRRGVHVVFVERQRIGRARRLDVDVVPAAVAGPRLAAVEPRDAVAVGVDRVGPGAVERHALAQVGGGEHRAFGQDLRRGARGAEPEQGQQRQDRPREGDTSDKSRMVVSPAKNGGFLRVCGPLGDGIAETKK